MPRSNTTVGTGGGYRLRRSVALWEDQALLPPEPWSSALPSLLACRGSRRSHEINNTGHASPAVRRSSPTAAASWSTTNRRSSGAAPAAARGSPSCRGSADPAFGSAVFRARKRSSQIRVFGSAGNRTRSTVRPERRRCSSAATPEYSAALDQVQLSGFATNPRRTGFRWI